MNLLENIKDFSGLYGLSEGEIRVLCAELRARILSVTLRNGGHLSSSLGAVELTVALLRAFNPDHDKIIFDVGHQSYAYKLLTKRLESFNTLRRKDGIAGFPRIDESPYDFFTVGHSSTSISAAMGYAKARDLSGAKHHVVAVVGDGALLNGVSFEALNCIDATNAKVIIVLNDNKMSINPRVGGMADHLARLAVNPTYQRLKGVIKEYCHNMNQGGERLEDALSRVKIKLKSLLLPTNVFEELDLSYWGPFDGHNVIEMEDVFNLAKQYDKSLIIHVITKKGKGFKETEAHPSFFHGIGAGTPIDAADKPSKSSAKGWSAVMADTLIEIADRDERVVTGTAAMMDGTKLGAFAKKYPNRCFDVGISEEHLLVYAAGMAAGGLRPAICIYSTFLQRAADQIVHDICLPKLPVLIGIDRAGFVGEDGETHHGLLDVSWLRAVPNMTVAAPRDAVDLRFFVNGWLERSIPMAVRYPRGAATLSIPDSQDRTPAEWGKLEILRHGTSVCLIGTGSTVSMILKAADMLNDSGISPTVVDLRFIKPLDEYGLKALLSTHKFMVIAEENELAGGVGEAVAKIANDIGARCRISALGAPDAFVSHATRAQQWEQCGMTADNIVRLCIERNEG